MTRFLCYKCLYAGNNVLHHAAHVEAHRLQTGKWCPRNCQLYITAPDAGADVLQLLVEHLVVCLCAVPVPAPTVEVPASTPEQQATSSSQSGKNSKQSLEFENSIVISDDSDDDEGEICNRETTPAKHLRSPPPSPPPQPPPLPSLPVEPSAPDVVYALTEVKKSMSGYVTDVISNIDLKPENCCLQPEALASSSAPDQPELTSPPPPPPPPPPVAPAHPTTADKEHIPPAESTLSQPPQQLESVPALSSETIEIRSEESSSSESVVPQHEDIFEQEDKDDSSVACCAGSICGDCPGEPLENFPSAADEVANFFPVNGATCFLNCQNVFEKSHPPMNDIENQTNIGEPFATCEVELIDPRNIKRSASVEIMSCEMPQSPPPPPPPFSYMAVKEHFMAPPDSPPPPPPEVRTKRNRATKMPHAVDSSDLLHIFLQTDELRLRSRGRHEDKLVRKFCEECLERRRNRGLKNDADLYYNAPTTSYFCSTCVSQPYVCERCFDKHKMKPVEAPPKQKKPRRSRSITDQSSTPLADRRNRQQQKKAQSDPAVTFATQKPPRHRLVLTTSKLAGLEKQRAIKFCYNCVARNRADPNILDDGEVYIRSNKTSKVCAACPDRPYLCDDCFDTHKLLPI